MLTEGLCIVFVTGVVEPVHCSVSACVVPQGKWKLGAGGWFGRPGLKACHFHSTRNLPKAFSSTRSPSHLRHRAHNLRLLARTTEKRPSTTQTNAGSDGDMHCIGIRGTNCASDFADSA